MYRNGLDVSSRVQPQVSACCNFCGKSIGYNASASRNRNFMFSGGGAMRSRVSGGSICNQIVRNKFYGQSQLLVVIKASNL